tara:strand:- start:124 stop:1203 length:1080 start_codon:yes stop_codon:yes gene_type:complete
MIKTFEFYLILLFLKKILNNFLIFFALIFILSLFEEISFFRNSEVHLFYPVLIAILNVPSTLFEIFPFIFLVSTQFFFLDIIEKNELEVLKINGLTNLKVLRTLFFTSFILGLFLTTVFYSMSSKLKFLYLDIKNSHSNDDKYLAVIKENGLWIKDEIDDKILIINSDKILNNSLINVSIHEFDKSFMLKKIVQSNEVDISTNKWIIFKPLIYENNKTKQLEEKLLLKTHFNINKINSLFNNLASLGLVQLFKLKKDYKSLKYSTREVEAHLHRVFSLPLFVSIMTIITSIIMFNNKRSASFVVHLISGILFSVIIYYFYYLFNLLGENGKMPIILSIYLPFMILMLIALVGMIRLNEK